LFVVNIEVGFEKDIDGVVFNVVVVVDVVVVVAGLLFVFVFVICDVQIERPVFVKVAGGDSHRTCHSAGVAVSAA